LFESLKLSDIPKQQCGILRKPSSTRPVIWILEQDGVKAIVKDFCFNGFLFRNTIGRFLVWREKKAYERLKGLKGVPILYRAIDGLALVIEAIPGNNIEAMETVAKLSDNFFEDLRVLVDNIHERGLAHCDLKRAPNIILGDDGKPYIVDWAASISKREFGFFPLYLIYEMFIQDDLNAIIKIRLKHHPENVTPEEKNQYAHRSIAEKVIRNIKDKIKDFLKKIA
jgi:RIO-like serine/threonine protein kinase